MARKRDGVPSQRQEGWCTIAEIKRLEQLVANLRQRAAKALKDEDVSVSVGYTQAYAIYVHERLDLHHPVGQAKFLEQPARQLQPELARIITTARKQGRTMGESLLLAGLRLQRESQQLCPVDTGALKGSAFTRLNKGAE